MMTDYVLIWVCIGLLIWLFTLLPAERKKPETPQWALAILFAVLWPVIVVIALFSLSNRSKP